MSLLKQNPPARWKNFSFRNEKPMPVFDWNRHVLHRFYAGVINKFEFFAAENFLQDRPEACFQRWLENVNLVRIDRAFDDVFTQAISGVDQNDVAKSALSVDREHDARAGEIRVDHSLHPN